MKAASNNVGRKMLAPSSYFVVVALTCTLLCPSGGAAGAERKESKTTRASLVESTSIEPGAKRFEQFDPSNFDHPEAIDHAWWPLRPGMQSVFEGQTEEDGKRLPHRLVFTVTNLVKEIGGVRARVILEIDYSGGKLVEKELAFFAQDKSGNVWLLGEYRETYDHQLVGGRIWNVNNPEGAKAGILMPADLRPGTPSYSQGYAPPPFYWTDRGRVSQTGQKVKGPTGTYDDVLVIEEFDAEHPGAFQLKYYARGVGNIRVGSRGKDEASETLDLVKTGQLSPKDLAEAQATALEMEKRATMYPAFPPLEQVPLAE